MKLLLLCNRRPIPFSLASSKKLLFSTTVASSKPNGDTSSSSMKGSTHWLLERGVSIALLPALSVGIYAPNSICNGLLAILLPIHCHWGIEQVITDYLPARRAGAIHYAAKGLLYVGTGLTVFGLFRYNTNDLGIGEGIKLLWKGE